MDNTAPGGTAGEAAGRAQPAGSAAGTRSGGSAEDIVLDVAREILKDPDLTLQDDFIEAGGNSLNGAQLVGRLNDELGTDLDVLDLFETADLAELGRLAGQGMTVREGLGKPADAVTTAGQGPLSGQQTAIWAAAEIAEPGAYNVPAAVLLPPGADLAWLERRLTDIVHSQPMLRCALELADGGAVQIVHPPGPITITRHQADLTTLTAAEGQPALAARLQELASRPLSPYGSPPARFDLLQAHFADGPRSALLLTFHHLFFDGWSWRLVLAALGGSELPVPRRSYLDHVAYQHASLDGEPGRELVAFWSQYLADAPALSWPADSPAGPAGAPSAGGSLPLTLTPEVMAGLREMARAERATIQMVMLTAWAALIWRVTAARDLCVSMPVACRRPEDESTVGCYVNTVVTRLSLDPAQPFRAALYRTRESSLRALAHRGLPADRILRLSGKPPVTTTMFDYQSGFAPITRLGDGGTGAELLDVSPAGAKYPLGLTCLEYGDLLEARLEFSGARFGPDTARGMLDDYREALSRISARGAESDLFALFETARAPANLPDFRF